MWLFFLIGTSTPSRVFTQRAASRFHVHLWAALILMCIVSVQDRGHWIIVCDWRATAASPADAAEQLYNTRSAFRAHKRTWMCTSSEALCALFMGNVASVFFLSAHERRILYFDKHRRQKLRRSSSPLTNRDCRRHCRRHASSLAHLIRYHGATLQHRSPNHAFPDLTTLFDGKPLQFVRKTKNL